MRDTKRLVGHLGAKSERLKDLPNCLLEFQKLFEIINIHTHSSSQDGHSSKMPCSIEHAKLTANVTGYEHSICSISKCDSSARKKEGQEEASSWSEV
jgi:hypothetical protein